MEDIDNPVGDSDFFEEHVDIVLALIDRAGD